MNADNSTKKEPLFHITKNDSSSFIRSLSIRLGAIAAALLFVGVLGMALFKASPLTVYGSMIEGIFIDPMTLFQNTALLLMFGLAVVPAFQMKFWNLGANGQVLVGCLASVGCMIFLPKKFPDMSNTTLILIMLCASILVSCLWSVLPAIFKAYFNTNETLFTLMLNYIAITMVEYFVFKWDKSGSGRLDEVNAWTGEQGWMPPIGDGHYLFPILVASVLTVVLFVYMKFTKHGFEVSLVGESINTAKYVGINVKKVIIRTLLFGGVICGILGFIYASALEHTVTPQVGGLGFTAILVAWLAGFNPVIMMFTSLFVVSLTAGSAEISTNLQLTTNDFADIVVGIIFFFVIACEFFIRFNVKINLFKKNKKEAD